MLIFCLTARGARMALVSGPGHLDVCRTGRSCAHCVCALLAFGEILQRDRVQHSVNRLLNGLPHVTCHTPIGPRASMETVKAIGDREWMFQRPHNLANPDLRRRPSKLQAAIATSYGMHKLRRTQEGYKLLQILQRKTLRFGNVLHRPYYPFSLCRKVYHGPQSVSRSCRKLHPAHPFFAQSSRVRICVRHLTQRTRDVSV